MISDVVLSSLINLFALLGSKRQIDVDKGRDTIAIFLTNHFGILSQSEYLNLYNELRQLYSQSPTFNYNAVFNGLVKGLANNLHAVDCAVLLLRLMEFALLSPKPLEEEALLFEQVAATLAIDDDTYRQLFDFVAGRPSPAVRLLSFPGMVGYVTTLWLKAFNRLFFTYHGDDAVLMNDVPVLQGISQQWAMSGILRPEKSAPVYYTEVMAAYLGTHTTPLVTFAGRHIEYHFPHSVNGLHEFSFTLSSGEMVAIMGGSGTGKTTLQSLLNGTLLPHSGTITLNGHDIHRPDVATRIGYVPQDDLLISDLTVFQNLWYTAQLAFAGLSRRTLQRKVLDLLDELDLLAVKDLKVGTPLKKYISGGQRKRLNIALELIRQPLVLFLDEPTSGLSSSDAERVMLLLKKQTLAGRLVIVGIHQPSSDIYKLFDRLWILDRGGYPIYDGNPIEAITYFKKTGGYADSATSVCPTCGNVSPEIILHIVDAKRINKAGSTTEERKITPETWHRLYLEEQRPPQNEVRLTPLPATDCQPPSLLRQWAIQCRRALQTRLASTSYLLITLLEAPVLALICGWLTRYTPPNALYTLSTNKHYPTFLFMAVIVSIFLGMSGSAGSIISDRPLLRRERFLHLSHGSYIFSKVALMTLVALLQTQLFVLVGRWMMGVEDLYLVWSTVLFLTAFVAGMTGLLLSQVFNTVASIYITIPLLIVPEIMLCGLVIDFRDLRHDTPDTCPPLVADLIPSRWAFEQLAVASYTHNDYQRTFFAYERPRYEYQYYRRIYLPAVEEQLDKWETARADSSACSTHSITLLHALPPLARVAGLPPFEAPLLHTDSLRRYLQEAEDSLATRGNRLTLLTDRTIRTLRHEMGNDTFSRFTDTHTNQALFSLLTGQDTPSPLLVENTYLVPQAAALFLTPTSPLGDAPFYSAVKRVGHSYLSTLLYNALIQLIMALAVLFMLLTDCPAGWLRHHNASSH